MLTTRTLRMRKTLRAAVTEAWTFLMLPGSLALRNMHKYCNCGTSVHVKRQM
jgi:hypothetical protein